LPCQKLSLSSREDIHQEKEEECFHEKTFFTYYKEKVDSGSCRGCEKESIGQNVCTCGIIFCNDCFNENYPETKDEAETENNSENAIKSSEGDCHYKELSNLKYDPRALEQNICAGGCGRSSIGYMSCVCGKNLCMICFETNYPDQANKYPEVEMQKEIVIEDKQPVAEVHKGSVGEILEEPESHKETVAETQTVLVDTNRSVVETKHDYSNSQETEVNTREPNERHPSKCPKWHKLVRLPGQDIKRICSKCFIGGLIDYHYCEACDYTHCESCFTGEVPQSNYKCCIIM
jgi:hypothetical protein